MPKRPVIRFEDLHEELSSISAAIAVPPRFPDCSPGALEEWLAQEKATRHNIDGIVREWLIPPRRPLPNFSAPDAGWLALRLHAARCWSLIGSHFAMPMHYSVGAVYRTLLIDSWPDVMEYMTDLLQVRWQAYQQGKQAAQSQSHSE
jgi:hypothetical protein